MPLPSNTFPVDTRNFKCIFFAQYKKFFCLLSWLFVQMFMEYEINNIYALFFIDHYSWHPFTDIVDPHNEGHFGN